MQYLGRHFVCLQMSSCCNMICSFFSPLNYIWIFVKNQLARPSMLVCRTDKLILRRIQRGKISTTSNPILKNTNKVGRLLLPNFKNSNQSIIIKPGCWWKNTLNRSIKQNSLKTDTHKFSQLIFHKRKQVIQCRKGSLLTMVLELLTFIGKRMNLGVDLTSFRNSKQSVKSKN